VLTRGRSTPRPGGYSERVCIVGRQSGKSRVAATLAVFEAIRASPLFEKLDAFVLIAETTGGDARETIGSGANHEDFERGCHDVDVRHLRACGKPWSTAKKRIVSGVLVQSESPAGGAVRLMSSRAGQAFAWLRPSSRAGSSLLHGRCRSSFDTSPSARSKRRA
jgi:hypothetical protein